MDVNPYESPRVAIADTDPLEVPADLNRLLATAVLSSLALACVVMIVARLLLRGVAR